MKARRSRMFLLPVAIDPSYSYAVPSGMSVAPGDFVDVPLGTK